ncbi:MAG: S1C family serine protease [Hydrogenophaga sp.]|uniref:S1C family serine protease n=1 Tax=Hydrogenophaga sp. TaxID=1904254 RepID=UPI003D0C6779
MPRCSLLATSMLFFTAWAQAQAQTPSALAPEVLFERVAPSVWVVNAHDDADRLMAKGSAVVIGAGSLITNCHVLVRAKRVTVSRENVTYGATLEHPDTERDLCQLKVANFTAPAITMAPAESLRVGSRVYAIGNPRGLETTISDGLLSGIRRSDTNDFTALQITVPISAGSSGGGLFDAQGRLIGITTFYIKEGQNLNFALPATWIAEVPARAQAALAARQERSKATALASANAAAAAPTGDRVFEYKLRDRSTGNSQTVIYKLDRVDGDTRIFNQGTRVERANGEVITRGNPIGGEYDFAMPPGGWVSKPPQKGATWQLNYKVPSLGGFAELELTAQAAEESTVRIGERELAIVRVIFKGYTRRGFSALASGASYEASAWYSPELGRVVRFDARTRGGAGSTAFLVDEVLELTSIRPE